MFESAELGHAIDKKAYDKARALLRADLLDAQTQIAVEKKIPVIVLVGGVDNSGKGDTVNTLSEWMDPRHIQTHAMGDPTDEECERPPMWRFWRALPPKGKVGIFFGSWYTRPIFLRARDETKNVDLERSLEEIARFERMLFDEGALIVKFWLHLSKKKQKERMQALEHDRRTRWRVTEADWKNHANYDALRRVSERALRETSTAQAPWIVVEAFDARYRNLTVGKTLRDAMRGRLDQKERKPHAPEAAPMVTALDDRDVLRALDLTKSLSEKKYESRLAAAQERLNIASRSKKFQHRAVVVAFEGNDAAGKGGAIRRVTRSLDARFYHVHSIAAPSEEERAQPYLWRFWRHLPRRAHFAIFDRSWYGRVLVERVEGFTPLDDWMRAYGEINDFEERVADHGIILVKFWLSISKKEQLARFEARKKTAFKRYKITEEDWRNRKKWPEYERAVVDMVDRTSTDVAPWHLIEANDKHYARVKILETLCERIEKAL
jgi:polyphosphate:AMP phosphotransferase